MLTFQEPKSTWGCEKVLEVSSPSLTPPSTSTFCFRFVKSDGCAPLGECFRSMANSLDIVMIASLDPGAVDGSREIGLGALRVAKRIREQGLRGRRRIFKSVFK